MKTRKCPTCKDITRLTLCTVIAEENKERQCVMCMRCGLRSRETRTTTAAWQSWNAAERHPFMLVDEEAWEEMYEQ